jgi:glycerophosphoryl diester phosphodiesterase
MPPWPFPLWIAHRGAGKLAPENTLAAFRLGATHGHTAFECDVKLSADGVPFLLHDDTLERTTNGQGVAGALDWAALSRLDAGGWHSSAFAGEPIASLEAIAAFCIANGHRLDLEIKPSPGTDLETGRTIGQWVRKLWHGTPLLLSSFKPQALMGARETAPELPRALLLDTLWPGCMPMAASLTV